MDATAGGWIAAYLEWTDADRCAIESTPGSVPAEPHDAMTCSCEEIADAYLEWMATPSFGRRAGDRVERTGRAIWATDAAELDSFREAMLLRALQTEADCLHLLRHAVDDGPSPSVRLIVEALVDADRLCEDEQRAWAALAMLRRGTRASPHAADGRWQSGSWPQALASVAGDVHALATKVLALQLH